MARYSTVNTHDVKFSKTLKISRQYCYIRKVSDILGDMNIHFTKMHGLGNDFVVIDAIHQTIDLSSEQVRFIADRHFGIGCDQILLVEKPDKPSIDFRYRIFNADGGEVEQCGNGARCFARFVYDHGLADKTSLQVSTKTGDIILNILQDGQVQVDMGIPVLVPEQIPFQAQQQQTRYTLSTPMGEVELGAVSMGNPHAVIVVDNTDTAPVASLGALIETDSHFPKRVNVGFMQIIDRHQIKLRVFERGVGETLACGTGACAAVVSGILRGLLTSPASVHLPGGILRITWEGEGQPVIMTGPAQTVFTGTITL